MATCHSLIKLKGELTGNPLDVKLFEAIEWELKEQHNQVRISKGFEMSQKMEPFVPGREPRVRSSNPDSGITSEAEQPKRRSDRRRRITAGKCLTEVTASVVLTSEVVSFPQKIAPSNLEIAVLKTYPFDSAVQRMTVVAKKKGSQHFDVYVKGAPEKVASLCRQETSEEEIISLKGFSSHEMRPFPSSPIRLQLHPPMVHQAGPQSHRGSVQTTKVLT